MPQPKRFLPPISALRALESFERTKNVSETGRELGLSQSAVSRQLKVLEEYLDCDLFVRDRKKILLTPAAQTYSEEVRTALDVIGAASLRLKVNPTGGQLNLAILPAFGVRWLAPKLPGFVAAHPEVTINLSTRVIPFDFANEPFHGAVHFGAKDWPDVQYLKLMTETVVAVASPALRENLPSSDVMDIFELPLLHLETRPNAWEIWADKLGFQVKPQQGMLFDQFASMIQAATNGLGAAVIPTYLIERELAEGSLVQLGNADPLSIGSYYFVWPKNEASYLPCELFQNWLGTFSDQNVE